MATKPTLDEKLAIFERIKDHYKSEINHLEGISRIEEARITQAELLAERQKMINEYLREGGDIEDARFKALIKQQHDEQDNYRKLNKLEKRSVDYKQEKLNIGRKILGDLKLTYHYLMSNDKIIRNTILGLGLSGIKAEAMRVSFEKSAGHIAMLGGTIEDVQKMMEGFTAETGRARVLTENMVKDIAEMGRGTGMGIDGATKLTAQFEIMGLGIRTVKKITQQIVDDAERMGVSSTKALKGIDENFKRINTYSFRNGVQGISQMALDAEKFKISITDALNAADAGRTLESAIELAANLQVMGGKFAQTDPFEFLYLARNEPDKMMAKLTEMSSGIVTLRKKSDGTFEKFISPADRQRLENVGKSLGIAKEAMTEIAQRRAELDISEKQLSGKGLTKREKQLIEGAMIFNSENGKFEVQLAGKMRDITTLTKAQASAFEQEQSSLEERAREVLTFHETLKSLLEILKVTLLPIIRGFNSIVKPLYDTATAISKWSGDSTGWVKAGLILLAGATAWRGAGFLWKAVTGSKMMGGSGGATPTATTKPRNSKGQFTGGKNAGKGMLRGGAGIGAAAVGIGAGVALAAVGIGELAKAIKDVDVEKLKIMNKTLLGLGIGMTALIAGTVILGSVGTLAAPGILAVGGAVALIGAGIGAAAWGIGEMSKGLSTLVTASKGAGSSMMEVGKGVAMLSASMLGFTFGGIGLITFATTMKVISKNASALAVVGNAFQKISTVLSGSKEDYVAIQDAINSIANANTSGGGMLAELANLLKHPLKVEFADKTVSLRNDITLNIDGSVFMNKVYDIGVAIRKHENARHGLESKKG